MRIQHNILAMNAYRNYNTNTKALAANLEKLSSGYKINRAGDDAAGLAISEKMRAQIKGLEAASKNVKDGTSLVKTAEGAMQEIQDMLGRMKYLATQSANGTYDNEVDRKALQDEVNQLREEINRIADSANFNGIKLLNGKMGLNEDAFAFSEAAAVEVTDGTIDISSLFSAANANETHLEKAGNTTQVNPGFTIDFGSLAGTTTAANQTLKFEILGQTITADLGAAGAKTANDIAGAARTELLKTSIAVDKTTGAAGAANDAVKVGDFVFEVGAAANGEVTFTYAGHFEGTTYKAAAGNPEFTEDQAKAINDAIGQGVKKVAGGSADAVITGDVIHDTTKVAYAQAKTPSSLSGIDLKITADMVKNGTKITIDGTEFTVYSDPTDTTAAGTNDLDIRKATTDEERIHMLVDALSNKTTTANNGRTFKISSAGKDTIHIDQVGTSSAGNEIDTYDKLKALVSVKGEAVTTAKNVGTTISVTDGNVDEGDGLTIDGKRYQFTDDADLLATTGGNTTYVAIKGGAAQNLANAIGASAEFDAANNTVTVRAATADDKAPVVLGKGLQLQIGDTSDPYNQMGVLVNDMHTAALGIDKLSIADPESASAAIQTVMDAINSVSSTRGTLGAIQNRLDHTANNLSVMTENIQDAESTIRDTDVAEEMMAYTKNNILVQSAQAMLAQANAVPQGVLQLLG